jgi:hypothetical protein
MGKEGPPQLARRAMRAMRVKGLKGLRVKVLGI